MYLVGLLLVVVLLNVFAVFCGLRFDKQLREGHPFIQVTPWEWVLILCPAASTLVLFYLLRLEFLQQTIIDMASTSLDIICASRLPIQLCLLPRPLTEIAVLQVTAYLTFLISSLALAWYAFFAEHQLPSKLDSRTVSFALCVGAVVWVFLLFGGQLYGRAGAPNVSGLEFAMLNLVFGALCFCGVCLGLRYRKYIASRNQL